MFNIESLCGFVEKMFHVKHFVDIKIETCYNSLHGQNYLMSASVYNIK